MLSSCSPQHDSCVMVQIYSPSHSPQYDPHSAIREIRRSLSRSPSRSAEARQLSYRSSPVKGSIPFHPSPLSPSRRFNTENSLHSASFSAPHQIRLGPSSRVHRPTLRRSVQGLSVMRTRTSPKSPSKRGLLEFHDYTQSSPMLRKRSSEEAEIESDLDIKHIADKENTHQFADDVMTWKSAHTRQEKRRSGGILSEVVPLSPMKRSSEPMNLDQPDCPSPSSKRRSVHTSSGMDFSIFDADAIQSSLERRAQDDNDWCRPSSPFSTSRFSTIPKRSSSLRKSTLQQRQPERLVTHKHAAHAFSSQTSWTDGSPDVDKQKSSRLSLDNHLPAMSRDSPFSAQGTLLNASIHPLGSAQNSQTQVRHPLSRTLTQSSSTPSTQDDSPTHEPIRRPDRPMSHDFSKSLPVGAMRPAEDMTDESENSSQNSFATPANYKFAKPLPAAFMSTGLISKKNRNAEEPDAGLPKAHMPDTPCKKQPMIFEANNNFKAINHRASQRQPFGPPATPSETPRGIPGATPFPRGKSVSLFGPRASKSNLTRKASFASIESEDKLATQSPVGQGDSQSTDADYPPTPTKLATIENGRSDTDNSPSHSNRHTHRAIAGSTQVPHFASISPNFDNIDRFSPHTPHEGIFPPDPSGLSISGRGDRPATRGEIEQVSFIPATPTGPREYFGNFSNRPSLNLNDSDVADVDCSLKSKFTKVDLIGTGEFSQVYRVASPPAASPFTTFNTSRPPSRTSFPDRVWAVKKSRYAYSGPKDRQRKIHEVNVLKALGHAEHVVAFVDSWEDSGHLYIQTEFCEEGTLDVFLSQAGLKARLDDFRIWKILLELSLGLKHVHDRGFIHLDLKPANVLITFDGTLKIGDFGMATKWPAKADIEGEGDREYIGPEILMGQYDKPADVFALGLIMLETAGNVELPDNGASWQKLRQGDMSDVPSLTFSSSDSATFRDASGNPLVEDESDASQDDPVQNHAMQLVRSGELIEPPEFMINPDDQQALDHIVRWMISPAPLDRPVVDQILQAQGVQFVESRRRAGATIFEGNWGPADDVIAEDAEMIDV